MQKLADGDCETPGDLAAHWAFAYDGDGVRTATLYTPYIDGDPQDPVLTTYYFGGLYEVTGESVRKYYAIAGQTLAMHDGAGLKYFLTDHLGSILSVLDDTSAVLSEQRYLPFGQVREDVGTISETDFAFTGQRQLDAGIGLMDYKARFYSSKLGRFTQPDTIVPGIMEPQSLNRFGYVYSNPLRYADPMGHYCVEEGKDGKTLRVDCKSGDIIKPKPRPQTPSSVRCPQNGICDEKDSLSTDTLNPSGLFPPDLYDAILDFQDAFGEDLHDAWGKPSMDATQLIVDEAVKPTIIGLSEPIDFAPSIGKAGTDIIRLGVSVCTSGANCGQAYQNFRLAEPSLPAIDPITIEFWILVFFALLPGPP